MDGLEYYKMNVNRNGKDVTVYIDPKTYYVAKQVTSVDVNGTKTDMTTTMSNYKKIDASGIYYPMTVETQQGNVTLSNVEVNTLTDESIFQPTK